MHLHIGFNCNWVILRTNFALAWVSKLWNKTQATLLFHSLLVSCDAFYLTVTQQLSTCEIIYICPIWVNLVFTTVPERQLRVLFFLWFCVAMHLVKKMKNWRGWGRWGSPSVPQQSGTNPSRSFASLRDYFSHCYKHSCCAWSKELTGTIKLTDCCHKASGHLLIWDLDNWVAYKWNLEFESGEKCSKYVVGCKTENLQHFLL